MSLPKTNIGWFNSWIGLGLIGFLLNLTVIRTMMYSWPKPPDFFYDVPYSLYLLFVADIMLFPAMFAACAGIIFSIKRKQYLWLALHVAGLLVIGCLAVISALPILFPSRGL